MQKLEALGLGPDGEAREFHAKKGKRYFKLLGLGLACREVGSFKVGASFLCCLLTGSDAFQA